jgi:hypothetical protein
MSWSRQRYFDVQAGVAGAITDQHLASVQLHNVLGDGQTQANAATVAIA